MTLREKKFIETVSEFYKEHGRGELPWRKTTNPYRILVSEIMLQQTQVERVIPKYKSFLKKFPNVKALAKASLGDVLREWQGLGYNRRAKMLHTAARQITDERGGKFPKDFEGLKELSGVGDYTAGAVMAFSYNVPIPFIETNVRTVYLHHFFKDKTDVTDKEILKYVVETVDLDNPREWNYALMDYGSYLKKTFGNPNSRSKHYTKQSTFKGSDREIRGAIIRALSEKTAGRTILHKKLGFDPVRIDAQLERLKEEGMLLLKGGKYGLHD